MKDYVYVEHGEIVRDGDEHLDDDGTWRKAKNIGAKVAGIPYRREATSHAAPWVVNSDEIRVTITE